MYERSYIDRQLVDAVAASHSWRGVLRALGLAATSAGSARSVRKHADRLGLSYSHFTGQRRWSEAQLRAAVESSTSWNCVVDALGLAQGGGTASALRAHAVRMGLSTEHFPGGRPAPADAPAARYCPSHLREAGTFFAATWFALHGSRVLWPLEPCRYDLLAERGGEYQRVQVKTTTAKGGDAMIMICSSRRTGKAVYAPDEIDCFFAIDGDLTAYLIPYRAVAGYGQIKLSHYVNFVVADRGQLISAGVSP